MADPRAGFIGVGVLLIVVGFFFSTIVCGVGVILLIVGLTIWRRYDED